jgi:hypothetical protein
MRPVLPTIAARSAVCLHASAALGPPRRRRMAERLLADAAGTGGGQIYRTRDGEALLLGTAPASAARVAGHLASLAGDPLAVRVWHLPGDSPALLRWAEGQTPTGSAEAPPPLPNLAGFAAALDRIAIESVLRADLVTGADGASVGRWLRLSQHAVAAAVGPYGADPDLVAHATEQLAARLLPGLGVWAADPGAAGIRMVPMPREAVAPFGSSQAVGVMPVALAADPALPALRLRLAERGWRLAFSGLTAAGLQRLRLEALPAEFLILRWSPALAEASAGAALQAVAPDRLILADADAEGRAWATRQDIGRLVVAPA